MRLILITIGAYAVFVLQLTLARDMAIAGFAPHLILAGLIVATSRIGGAPLLLLAAASGLVADCLADAPCGPDVVGFTTIVLIAPRAARGRSIKSPWSLAAASILLAGGSLLESELLREVVASRSVAFPAVAMHAAGSGLYTGILAAAAVLVGRGFAPRPGIARASVSPTVSNRWRMLTE